MDLKFEEAVARKWLALKESAEARGIEFSLSLQSLANIYRAKKCYYTGAPIVRGYVTPIDKRLTIDRKDASKGYVKGNVVACSHVFNQRKGALTEEDIKILYKKVVR